MTGTHVSLLSNTAETPIDAVNLFNLAFGAGGGVYNSGEMSLTNSRFVSNRSDRFGGAVASLGRLDVVKMEFSENVSALAPPCISAACQGWIQTVDRSMRSHCAITNRRGTENLLK